MNIIIQCIPSLMLKIPYGLEDALLKGAFVSRLDSEAPSFWISVGVPLRHFLPLLTAGYTLPVRLSLDHLSRALQHPAGHNSTFKKKQLHTYLYHIK